MVNNLKYNKSIKSLSMHNSEQIHKSIYRSEGTGVLFRIRRRGSMTVEAAVAIPLFLFVLSLFLGIFRVLQTEIQMEQALHYAAIRTAAAAVMESSAAEAAGAAAGRALLQKSLQDQECPSEYFRNGYAGILMLPVDDNDYIRYRVRYTVMLPVGVFGKNSVDVVQQVSARKWTGWSGENSDGGEKWIYITESGSAYHRSPSCRYLNLSIRMTDRVKVSQQRNLDGGKYYECPRCASDQKGKNVYITDYGTLYHSDPGCSSLKRTVNRVSEDQIGTRKPCSGCWNSDEKRREHA